MIILLKVKFALDSLLILGGHFGETSRSLRVRFNAARRVLDPDGRALRRRLVSIQHYAT